jgi:hypothetical protein
MADTPTYSWKLLYEAGRQALQARKLQEAEQSFSAALQLAEDFAAGDPRLAATLNALARIYSLQRRYLAAAALLNRLLEVTERTLGPSHVQVAGVLTNLAEMYTHLGAAREELELRERVLSIRADDPNADAESLQRLRERVAELNTALAAQDPPTEDEEDYEPLPIVRTAEYSAPVAPVSEPELSVVDEPFIAQDSPTRKSDEQTETVRDDAYRMSPATAQLSIAPWPGAAATATTPTGGRTVEMAEWRSPYAPRSAEMASPAVEMISVSEQPMLSFVGGGIDHGFSDMGRDELPLTIARRMGGRSSLYSIAAGVMLVAGLIAARNYVKGADDERVSAGSVNLASVVVPPPPPVMTPVPAVAAPEPAPDPRTVERLIADRLAEREAKRAEEARHAAARDAGDSSNRTVVERAPRVPTAADIERTLRGVDIAVKAVDLHTKAATDSATAIRLQAPTFKKTKLADP